MDKIELRYLQETGKRPTNHEDVVFKDRKGYYYIEDPTSTFMRTSIDTGYIEIPDEDFIQWMKDKLTEILL